MRCSSSFALVVPDTFTTAWRPYTGDPPAFQSASVVRSMRIRAGRSSSRPILAHGRSPGLSPFDEQTDQGNSGYVTEQAPAEALLISSASQNSVTRGQQEPGRSRAGEKSGCKHPRSIPPGCSSTSAQETPTSSSSSPAISSAAAIPFCCRALRIPCAGLWMRSRRSRACLAWCGWRRRYP